MDPIMNPFSPGAGCPPPALVGRDNVLEQARILLGRVLRKRSAKSMLLTGLRGVGKTVLLSKMEEMARKEGYKTIKFAVQEDKSLASLLIPQLKTLLYELDTAAGVNAAVRRALSALRNFIKVIKVQVNLGEIGIGVEAIPGLADSGDMDADLPALFQTAAEAAKARNTGIALLMDEVQLLSPEELNALILSMHQLQQTQAPMVLIGAGLPTLPRLAGEAKSYAERLFSYPIIDQLSREESYQALESPVFREGADFAPEAMAVIYERTKGYPYFLQEWGAQAWNRASGNKITLGNVIEAESYVTQNLDDDFFRVRFDRLTDGEKRFMRAMAELDDSGCQVGNVAQLLGVKNTAISLTRSNLIRKGMIYSPRHGVIDYSVPLFGDFLRRAIPEFTPTQKKNG